MADNVDITAGSGTTVHADEYTHTTLGSGKTQLVKLVDGTLDSDTPITVDVGAKANALRIAPANDITDGTYIGDIKFGEALPAGTNAIGKLAANSGVDIGDVTLTAGTAAIGKLAANTGVDIGDVDVTSIIPLTGATNLGKARDVTCGANDVGVMALAVRDDTLTTLTPADGDYAPLRVGSTGKLHVTDANITACNTGAVVVSSGTVSTVTNLAQMGGVAISLNEGVLGTGVQRVTLATDDDGVAHLATIAGAFAADAQAYGSGVLCQGDDGTDRRAILVGTDGHVQVDVLALPASTNTIEVVGDVAENAAVAGNPVLVGGRYDSGARTLGDGDVGAIALAVDGAVHIDDGGNAITVDGNLTTVTTVTTCSTVTNLSQLGGTAITMDEGVHGTGCQRITIATDDDGVLSLGIIDDWDATHNSAASADGPQLMAAYDSAKPAVVEDADAVRVLADAYGRLLAGVEPQAFEAVFDSGNATAEANVVYASAETTIIVVQSYVISSDVEGWIKLQDEEGVAKTGKFWLKAGGGVAITLPDKAPIVLASNKDLEVICEAVGNVSVSVTGYTIPG